MFLVDNKVFQYLLFVVVVAQCSKRVLDSPAEMRVILIMPISICTKGSCSRKPSISLQGVRESYLSRAAPSVGFVKLGLGVNNA